MTTAPSDGQAVRVSELVALMSLGTDLGLGQPMEHVLRQCLIALRLGERLGLDESERAVVYYAGAARVGRLPRRRLRAGQVVRRRPRRSRHDRPAIDLAGLAGARVHAAPPRRRASRLWTGRASASTSPAADAATPTTMIDNHWLAADDLADASGSATTVRDSVEQTFERWDGKGVPEGAKGEAILLTSRLVNLADVVEVFHRAGGVEAAVDVARDAQRHAVRPGPGRPVLRRGGGALRRARRGDDLGRGDRRASPRSARALRRRRSSTTALEAIADFVDLKSPYTIGHSRGVADLASGGRAACSACRTAPRTSGGPGSCTTSVGSACSNAIWDKAGRLTRPRPSGSACTPT